MNKPDALFQQILRARNRVYQLCSPTPQERYPLPGGGMLLLKREDLSPIHSFKWRGAFNMLSAQKDEILHEGVVAASVGNHALGVALAAARLQCTATIFLPKSVGRVRSAEVEAVGGAFVKVHIAGDSYEETQKLARAFAEEEDRLYIPADDEMMIMAGHGTIGDEMMLDVKPDVLFLQMGSGSFAAAVACAVKAAAPEIHIVGVENAGQARMAAALAAGKPVQLPYVDVFCDATSDACIGETAFAMCQEYIDEFMTVTNDDVCAAIQRIWEIARVLPEPSGALGMAALLKRLPEYEGMNLGVVLTGSNMDFSRLAWISRRAKVGLSGKRYFEVHIPEKAGAMLTLLRDTADLDLNIEDFIYGKMDVNNASPIFGFAGSEQSLVQLQQRLTERGYSFKDVSSREDVTFRIVNCQPQLFKRPFLAVLEFPERPGALMEFMDTAAKRSSICYFNYANWGEQFGRALMGFEFESDEDRQLFLHELAERGPHHTPVDMRALHGK